jgi:hypothetical protein
MDQNHFIYVTQKGIAIFDTDTKTVKIIFDKIYKTHDNNYVQIIGTSYRALSFLIDSDKFYIKEEYTNKNNNLPGLTRRYTLLAFNNSAQA